MDRNGDKFNPSGLSASLRELLEDGLKKKLLASCGSVLRFALQRPPKFPETERVRIRTTPDPVSLWNMETAGKILERDDTHTRGTVIERFDLQYVAMVPLEKVPYEDPETYRVEMLSAVSMPLLNLRQPEREKAFEGWRELSQKMVEDQTRAMGLPSSFLPAPPMPGSEPGIYMGHPQVKEIHRDEIAAQFEISVPVYEVPPRKQ